MKLKVSAFAVSTGAIFAIAIAFATILSLIRGSGSTLGALMVVFPGYSVSGAGVIIGLVYGFIYGLVAGAIFALIYNAVSKE